MRPLISVFTLLALLPLAFSSKATNSPGLARLDRDRRGLFNIGGFDHGKNNNNGQHGQQSNPNVCPSKFQCDGSGDDGYSLDIGGNGPPSGYPSDWLYFGV